LSWEDRLLIDNWRDHGVETRSVKLKLEAGHAYAFRLEYFQNGGDAVLKLLWSLPGASAFEQAVAAARKAEVAIVVAGISPEIEGEEMDTVVEGFHRGDRTRIDLPVIQEKLLQAVHATGTPVVLVVLSGSGVTVNWAQAHLPAILAAWYPGQQGGAALADVLFGDYNPAGRLPVTVYESVEQLPPFEDYRMANRTYRYFTGTPLYPFGFGLSYTQFSYENVTLSAKKIKVGEPVEVQVTVRNSGKIAGDEVVQVYVSAQNAPVPVALKALKGFRRISLAAGASQVVRFTLNPADFSHIDAAFQRVSAPGEFKIRVGGSSASGISASLRIE
jgi:beta-glucosidase